LYGSRYSAGSWGTSQRIDTLGVQYFSAWAPKVAMDDAGNAIVVWQQNDGTAERIYARRFSVGTGSYEPIQRLNDSADFTAFNASAPAIAMDPVGGTAMAVWSQYGVRGWRQVFDSAPAGGDCVGNIVNTVTVNDFCDSIRSMVFYNGKIYLGMGDNVDGDASIYVFDPVTETAAVLLDNDEIKSILFLSASTLRYDEVDSMAVVQGYLYVGLGADSTSEGDVIYCYIQTNACDTAAAWDILYDSFPLPSPTSVRTIVEFNSQLYFGGGNNSGNGDIFRCNLQDNDFGCSDLFAVNGVTRLLDTGYEAVPAMAAYGGYLYAGFGTTIGDADLLRCDPGANARCDASGEWAVVLDTTSYTAVRSMIVHDGWLYVGLEGAAGDGDVLRCNITATGCDQTADWDGNTTDANPLTPVFDGGVGGYEAVLTMATHQGFLYIGLGNSTGDADIWRCAVCDAPSDFAVHRDDTGTYEAVTALLSAGSLYAAYGSTASTDADLFSYDEGWYTVARRFRFASGTWATTDNACPDGSGLSDGICFISGGGSITALDAPVVAMDQSGRAIVAFTREVAVTCLASETDTDRATLPPDTVCYDGTIFVNQFDAALSPAWGGGAGPIEIDPGAPVDTSTLTDANDLCFQAQEESFQNLSGLNSACVTASQPRIAMDRSGNAVVVMKVHWSETEAAQDSSEFCNSTVPNDPDGGLLCDDPFHGNAADSPPPDSAEDDWSGNAIAARRYAAGCGWTTACWPTATPSLTFLYAHSSQPSNATSAGGSQRFYNCPSSGQVLVETNRYLIECQLNAPQIAIGDTDNNAATLNEIALAVWERFDGTNHDLFANCFTQTSLTTCGGGAATGWRAGTFIIPEPGAVGGDCYTAPYFVLNDPAWTPGSCPPTGSGREAYSPQAALDSTGNGLAVWTQKDAAGRWRIYGMRFVNGVGLDTASRGTIDNYSPGDNKLFTNPVLAMESSNPLTPGNVGKAWALFLESEVLEGALLPTTLNVRVKANQWVP
jgi:hypothetical protein